MGLFPAQPMEGGKSRSEQGQFSELDLGVPFRVLFIRLSCCFGDLRRDPSLENYLYRRHECGDPGRNLGSQQKGALSSDPPPTFISISEIDVFMVLGNNDQLAFHLRFPGCWFLVNASAPNPIKGIYYWRKLLRWAAVFCRNYRP